jgi:catechol 2,3-dioxygenase-like lactoylglutathione lyase family enzyme
MRARSSRIWLSDCWSFCASLPFGVAPTAKDLRGKRFSLGAASSAAYVVNKYLNSLGLSTADIEMVRLGESVEAQALAAFYAELLGLPVTWQEDDFAVVSRNDRSSGIGFQLAPGFQPPRWPDPSRPQQMHFDVMVDDVDAAEPQVLALGARRLTGGESGARVYADPAGHPFCLIPRPGWAAPIGGTPGEI